MSKTKIILLFLLLFVKLSFFAQTADSLSLDTNIVRKDAPNLYFDCEPCFQQYYRQNLAYVNFVRDRRLADIYVMVTINQSGSGGNIYKLFFTGEKKFEGIHDTLSVTFPPNAATAEQRAGILKVLKRGILPFLVKTPLIDKIEFDVKTEENNLDAGKIKDKWNFWSFKVGFNGFANGNSYSSNMGGNADFSINKTTDKIKTETGGWFFGQRQVFEVDSATTIKAYQSNSGVYHLLAFSLGKHFAVGHFALTRKSTPENLIRSTTYMPGIEYNVFPYDQASRRQMRFVYRIGGRYQDYIERTIYLKTNAWYAIQSFVFKYSQQEKWGSIDVSAGGWHYLNHPKNYNLSLYPSINFNPAKGLQVGLWAGLSIVKDQFFISANGATPEEILLQQKNLQTDYNYNYGFNVRYTFGSIYNNIINVRFDLGDDFWQ